MESGADQRDLVIKVKYGESLKRFTASVRRNILDQNMATLRAKIISAFNFTPTTDFVLTYTDTDGDMVMLSDDEDLNDAAIKQRLDPLRITVQLKSNGSVSPSSASEPKPQSPNHTQLAGLPSLPEQLNNTISKVTEDIVTKATSAPVLAELLNVFSKLAVPETPQPVNNNEPKVSSTEPSKETKKGPPSDKPESSNARGAYYHHFRKLPNPPFCAPPPPPFVPPFSPICRSGRNPDPPIFAPTENNGNVLPFPTRFFPSGHPYRKADESFFQGVHRGIQCDGCDATPIVGPRFKSTVKEDYDLCSACFSRMGNEVDYTRIDRPDPHRIFRDLSHPRHNNGHPVACPMRPKRSKLESRFIQDVTVLDGTLMAPLTPFTKIWRMRNNGSTIWPFGTQLVWVGGDQFSSQASAQIEISVNGFPVDQEIDIAVDFCAPARAGRYISYWRLASPSGQKFGQRVWVLIQVEQPNNTENNIKSAINLNLPPESNMPDAIEMDINVEPTVETAPKPIKQTSNITYPVVDGPFSQSEPVGTSQTVPFVTQQVPIMAQPVPVVAQHFPLVAQPVPVQAQPVPFVTQNIPLVAQPVPVPVQTQPVPVTVTQPEAVTVHAPSPLGSYPLIDLLSPSQSNAPLVDSASVEAVFGKSKAEEETLLEELEQMGFKQVDLNKEVLRLNKYDLDQSVEDLCGFSEWDPLLEELKEMGFEDKETNKKLLVKNGGSIKRVVMDLIAGEKTE